MQRILILLAVVASFTANAATDTNALLKASRAKAKKALAQVKEGKLANPSGTAKAPPTPPNTVKRLSTLTPAASVAPEPLVLAQRFGDVADDAATCVTVDGQGNVITAGYRTVESGSPHPFVLKRSATGVILFSNIVTGNMSGTANAVAVDASGNVFVTGNFAVGLAGDGLANFSGVTIHSGADFDIFVVKYSPSGQGQWVKKFGSPVGDSAPTDNGLGIAVDGSGVIVSGFFNSQDPQFGVPVTPRSGQNAFIAKLSPSDGHTVWVKTLNSTANTQAKCVTLGSDGSVFAGGCIETFLGLNATVDFGAGPQTVTSNAAWIVRWNADETLAWSKLAGQWADVRSLALHGSNLAAVGGYHLNLNWGGSTLTNPPSPFSQPISAWIADFSQAGTHNWSRMVAFGIAAPAVCVSQAGTVTTCVGGGLVAFDATGPKWTNSINGSALIRGLTASQNTYTVGSFNGTANFFGTNMASAGVGDIFLAELGASTVFGTPEPPMSITNIDGSIYAIALQRGGKVLTFYGTGRVDEGSHWPETLAVFTAVPDDQPVAIEVPSKDGFGNPLQRKFVKAVNSAPLALAPASNQVLSDSGKKLIFNGVPLRMLRVGNTKSYRLKP